MRRDRAVGLLRQLVEEASTDHVKDGGEGLTAWKAKTAGVLQAAIGAEDPIVDQFRTMRLRYTGPQWSGMDTSIITRGRHSAIRYACGLIEAAIHQLELDDGDNELWTFLRPIPSCGSTLRPV